MSAGAATTDNDRARLDPVSLMDVDPATAKWKSEYAGRTCFFCAPACKQAFDRNLLEYVSELGLTG